jgi:hypothetical protein
MDTWRKSLPRPRSGSPRSHSPPHSPRVLDHLAPRGSGASARAAARAEVAAAAAKTAPAATALATALPAAPPAAPRGR